MVLSPVECLRALRERREEISSWRLTGKLESFLDGLKRAQLLCFQ